MSLEHEERLSVADASRQAGITIEGIRNAIRRGKLKAEVVATRPIYRIRPEDLQAYLQSVEIEPRGRPRSSRKYDNGPQSEGHRQDRKDQTGGRPLSYRKLDPMRLASTLICENPALPC